MMLDFDNPSFLSLDEAVYGSRSVSECERHGMVYGCPGCPVLAKGDCDNEDAQKYKEEE